MVAVDREYSNLMAKPEASQNFMVPSSCLKIKQSKFQIIP